MASAVEARSLAILTTLASDPPLYPRNPTQLPHAPLTLYIVRVPGSKGMKSSNIVNRDIDVFLTPLKPREKVVSAEDVQSSLYFLHIDIPEDDLVELPEEIPVLDTPALSTITRKPLPTPPTSPADGSPRQRSAVFDTKQQLGVPQRKPVRQSLDLPDIPPRPPMRSPLSQQGQFTTNELPDGRPSFSRRPLSNQFLDPRDERCVSLTLIRRDPSSGFQWNVAKIRDPPVHDVSSVLGGDGSIKTKKTAAPLFIEIYNPGYSKFVQFDQTRPDSRGSADMASLSPNLSSDHDSTFRRRLYMDGLRFGDHSDGHRKTPSWCGEQQNQRPSAQLNRQSLQAVPKALADRRSKGYTFRSPWGGKCEFSTGATGRSLKCKHVLDNPSSAMTEVSELRFNLPTGSTTKSSPSSTDAGAKRSSFISRPSLHRHSTSDELTNGPLSPGMNKFLDEYGNIDLSLGQERAGGGFKGKQAKLGKLIIEDEGVKMLDLIVAANMALWWRAYERKH
ncbi:uncharacterized protein M437DRAFT_38159 [Aureobasidium melanogenum CBS 110374]|uniref:Oxidoreductase-like protein n=1 Tax=Aureobasidium melanogenum (strain CBS 110374) TaxID=1043003 RepID=A0A074WDF0_AURM1|nr:uncharacterized protein M437DRAFT_38159 [Aureobasidium melanogenum CBS 110374]KEQ67957.1 hypothetical protein M437DRAFT_38159 [Aureobasidium melanogenum CBS 110374]